MSKSISCEDEYKTEDDYEGYDEVFSVCAVPG